MIRYLSLIPLVVLSLAMPASAQDAPPATKLPGALAPIQPKMFPIGVAWTVKSFGGKNLTGSRPTFQMDSQLRIRGFAGCNTFSATAYPLAKQGLAVGPIATTKKECDKAVMDQEHAYLLAIRTANRWDHKGGVLVLSGQAGELTFERALF